MTDPMTNGSNGGRDARGRFVKGNPGGPGNPNAQRVAMLREAFRSTCSVSDIRAICRKLIALAKRGNVLAAREVLDRTLGKSAIVLEDQEQPQEVIPVIEVLVDNHDDFVEFSRIRDAMLTQIGEKGINSPIVALPSPESAFGREDSTERGID